MCHFLVPAQESNQRKRLKGARPSSRSTRVPLKNPPAPSPVVQYKTAGRRERSRRQEQDRDDVLSRRESATQSFRCARERYIGEGAFVVREHGISASPMAASFGTFLAETRKVRSIHWIDKSQFICILSQKSGPEKRKKSRASFKPARDMYYTLLVSFAAQERPLG